MYSSELIRSYLETIFILRVCVCVGGGGGICGNRVALKYSEKNLSHYEFVYHKSHIDYARIEQRLPQI
jgi:threonine dehydratase